MNILHTLQSVAHFFRNSRRQGHTTAMLNGARNTKDALVLTHDMRHAQTLARNNPTIDFTAIDHIDALTGHRRPVLIDHSAILTICEKAAATIERNQAEIQRLETELAQAARDQQTLTIAQQTIADLRVTMAKTEAELEAWRTDKAPDGWWVKHEDHIAQLNQQQALADGRLFLLNAQEERHRQETEQARLELCKIGLLPDKHQTLEQAIKGALQIAASLRRDLADPPVDVQEAVLTKLNLWETNKIIDAAKKLKAGEISDYELFDLLP